MMPGPEKRKNIRAALVGFAVMMTGMNIMGRSAAPLKDIPAFTNLLANFRNPLLGFGFALVFTMIIQSSDATVGILQALSLNIGITFGMSVPLICGAKVGTCITALLSSLDASNNGRRTALIQLYYNLFKTITFMIAFYALNKVLHFDFVDENVGAAGIPVMHTLINIVGAAVYLPLSGSIVRIAQITIPFSEKEKQEKRDTLTMLAPQFLKNPSFALARAGEASSLLARTVQNAYAALSGNSEETEILCRRIRKYREQILKYLAELLNRNIHDEEMSIALSGRRYCEAFGIMGEFISQHLKLVNEVSESLSEEALSDLHILREAVGEVIDFTVEGYEMEKRSFADTITIFREAMSVLHSEVTVRHIKRLHEGKCSKQNSPIFLDICYSLEKLVDTCDVIAQEAIFSYPDENAHSTDYEEKRMKILRLFSDKYRLLVD